MIKYLPVFLLAVFAVSASAAPPEAYSYWPEYQKVPLSEIRPQEWRTADDVIDGWDWSLPPNVRPAPNGLLAVQRTANLHRPLEKFVKPLDLPVNPTIALWIKWHQIEPAEGEYYFAELRRRIEEAESLGYAVVLRLLCSATVFAPDWIADKGIPHRKEHKAKPKVVNYEISHPEFHRAYIRLVETLGKSGIPRMENLKGAYVGYASPSYGDEGIGPHGKDPDSVPHVIARLDAWARAFKGVEHKVFMGGMSQHGLEQGFGIRRGFVEMFLYHIPDETIGQRLDESGYLWLDENAPALRSHPFHGEENEEYEESWATAQRDFRFGQNTVSFPYRYFTSNLRLLQMRCNYVLYNPFSLIPEQMVWVGQSLGRTVVGGKGVGRLIPKRLPTPFLRHLFFAIHRISPPTSRSLATLVETLRDKDASVRFVAAVALGTMGEGAESAIPALAQAALYAGHPDQNSVDVSRAIEATSSPGLSYGTNPSYRANTASLVP